MALPPPLARSTYTLSVSPLFASANASDKMVPGKDIVGDVKEAKPSEYGTILPHLTLDGPLVQIQGGSGGTCRADFANGLRNTIFKPLKASMDTAKAHMDLTRLCGGHLIAGAPYASTNTWLKDNIATVVALLDLIVGNTLVLVDRHPGNVARRRKAGFAGDYRLKSERHPTHPHSTPYTYVNWTLKYKVPSNFWLHDYRLFSLGLGLMRQALVIADSKPHADAFLAASRESDIKRAINANEADLAMTNLLRIEQLLVDMSYVAPTSGYTWPPEAPPQNAEGYALNSSNLAAFKHFASRIQSEGLAHWFPHDPLTLWASMPECHNRGWEAFAIKVVEPMRLGKKPDLTTPYRWMGFTEPVVTP